MVVTPDRYDFCQCGDYRHQHKDGVGPCAFNKPHGIGHGGAENCTKFRFDGRDDRAVRQPMEVPKPTD